MTEEDLRRYYSIYVGCLNYFKLSSGASVKAGQPIFVDCQTVNLAKRLLAAVAEEIADNPKKRKSGEIQAIIGDCWKLFRKYSSPADDDSTWRNLISDAHYVYENHGKSEFSKAIILGTVDEIDEIFKRNQKGMKT